MYFYIHITSELTHLHTIYNVLPLGPEVVGVFLRVEEAIARGHPSTVVRAEETHVNQPCVAHRHRLRRPIGKP